MSKKNKFEEALKEVFDAAELAGAASGLKPISKEDYDRFWKWMMVPLMDVPDDELIWCYNQDRQNSICSKSVWCPTLRMRLIPISVRLFEMASSSY